MEYLGIKEYANLNLTAANSTSVPCEGTTVLILFKQSYGKCICQEVGILDPKIKMPFRYFAFKFYTEPLEVADLVSFVLKRATPLIQFLNDVQRFS